MKNDIKIYGAGLAGLIAANTHFQNATIFEAGQEGSTAHKALLRFRTSAVGDAVGIEFKKVRVYKNININNKYVEPSIWLANQYSKKVTGKIMDRSIWNLDPVDRYIAPENFIEQLIDRVRNRINYGHSISSIDRGETPIISTIPMSAMLKLADRYSPMNTVSMTRGIWPEFEAAPIKVSRYRIKNCDAYQTIYFPDPHMSVYRVSLTGDMLIVESISGQESSDLSYVTEFAVHRAFGISDEDVTSIESVSQRFGKIAPIDNEWRRKFIFDLSHEYNIYSLGRFATWRNILLDDVLKDVSVIKKLMNGSSYDRKIVS